MIFDSSAQRQVLPAEIDERLAAACAACKKNSYPKLGYKMVQAGSTDPRIGRRRGTTGVNALSRGRRPPRPPLVGVRQASTASSEHLFLIEPHAANLLSLHGERRSAHRSS